jgi:hypothetical protein
MSLPRSLTRSLAVAAAAGALLATASIAPAAAGGGKGGEEGLGHYKGIVTAKGGIWLRERPDRSNRQVRFVKQGEQVSIYCKTSGDAVRGNPVWYLLTNGTWAWGSARYIANVGPAPRSC